MQCIIYSVKLDVTEDDVSYTVSPIEKFLKPTLNDWKTNEDTHIEQPQ